MSLAAKLPYDHAFAGGFSGIGSQALPTDADALDYLSRLATADGAGVETGVAVAVDAFFRGLKATPGLFEAIKASCILAGARTLAGALVPVSNGPLHGAAELYDASTNPGIINGGGSAGGWDASTKTFSNTNSSGTSTRPAFRFSFPGLVSARSYYISGRFSGDVGSVTALDLHNNPSLGNAGTLEYDQNTGEFSGTSYNVYANFLQIDTDGTKGPFAVTIEELSIKEAMPAPTSNGFVNGDFSRTSGLTGDGTSYIDSGRANDADPQNDNHNAVFISAINSFTQILGSRNSTTGRNFMDLGGGGYKLRVSARSDTVLTTAAAPDSGTVIAHARSDSAEMSYRLNGVTYTDTLASESPDVDTLLVYARRNVSTGAAENFSTNTLAFYSIGTSLSLEDLDTAITNLINRLKFALLVGENPSGLDPDTIAYIVSGYEAGGSLE